MMTTILDTAWANPMLATGAALALVSLIARYFLAQRNAPQLPKGCILPPKVPHRIPWLGNALEVGKIGFGNFATKYSAEYDGAPLVSALVAGKTMHVVADPAAFPSIFRYGGDTMSMTPIFKDFCKNMFGTGDTGIHLLMPERRKETMDVVHQHILHAEGLQQVTDTIQVTLNREMNAWVQQKNGDDGTIKCDLYAFVRRVMFTATLECILADSSASDDDFRETYLIFDHAIKTASMGMDIKSGDKVAYEAREKLIARLKDKSFVPNERMMQRREYGLKHGMNEDDVARDRLRFIWAAVANFIPSQFWMVYHIAKNKQAMASLRKEIDQIISERSSSEAFDGTFTNDELAKMVGLESAFKETIRMAATNTVMRGVHKDFVLDLKLKAQSKYFIKGGDFIVMYVPILHHDEHVFDTPAEFRWDRFLPNAAGKIGPFKGKNGDVINDPLRAFGGGAHYCPGRKFAANGAKSFVASLLYQYDIDVQGETVLDRTLNGFGVLSPKDDVSFEMKPRSSTTN